MRIIFFALLATALLCPAVPADTDKPRRPRCGHDEDFAQLLGKHKKELPQIIKNLSHKDENVRRKAAVSLRNNIALDKSHVPELLKMLKTKDVVVAGSVVIALGRIGDPRAIAPLREMFDAKHGLGANQPVIIEWWPDVNARIIDALMHIPSAKTEDLLLSVLEIKPDFKAIRLLGIVGTRARAVPKLIEILKLPAPSHWSTKNWYHHHGIPALINITGMNFGDDAGQWIEWYEKFPWAAIQKFEDGFEILLPRKCKLTRIKRGETNVFEVTRDYIRIRRAKGGVWGPVVFRMRSFLDRTSIYNKTHAITFSSHMKIQPGQTLIPETFQIENMATQKFKQIKNEGDHKLKITKTEDGFLEVTVPKILLERGAWLAVFQISFRK